ncbi:carbohydrate kinase, thermoresistant glucokinase family [Rubellimicrobium thermophilum DSM 16684]|uniref:Gluconokinase n=1 Tax=Rubellimicrobium thermophilum DSM 16684 TaxID=1123069 RepID=S9S285_9RHOB|nr:gluconokinase [Rubellimicrobium thermophilum]EPX84345.1 carbohydrate kinase, thermoresistant glucokinase family [Rubellimicrobium thermophilum DSM 16684]
MEEGQGRFVIMGVSAAGKTRIGQALAAAIGARFIEGDDLHPPANRAKMASGVALTDEDRWPWLDRVGAALAGERPPVVAACSALRRIYRDRLRRAAPDTVFLHLAADRTRLAERIAARQGHFMPPSLLDSQIATLEPLDAGERGLTVDAEAPPEAVIAALRAGIARL